MWCKDKSDKDRFFVQIRIELEFFGLDLAHRLYFFRIHTVLLVKMNNTFSKKKGYENV